MEKDMEKEIKNLIESLRKERASRPKIPLPDLRYKPKGIQKGVFYGVSVQEYITKQNK